MAVRCYNARRSKLPSLLDTAQHTELNSLGRKTTIMRQPETEGERGRERERENKGSKKGQIVGDDDLVQIKLSDWPFTFYPINHQFDCFI